MKKIFLAFGLFLSLTFSAHAQGVCNVHNGFPGARYGLLGQILTDTLPCYGINGNKGSPVALQTCGSWTVLDESGASLGTLTANVAYCQTGNLVTAYGNITWPSNASGLQAAFSLPVPVPNQVYANNLKSTPTAAATTNVIAVTVSNTSPGKAVLTQVNNITAVSNTTMSTNSFTFVLIYPSQ